nr:CAP domain-containing protein [Streptomyces sp. NBC_00974]
MATIKPSAAATKPGTPSTARVPGPPRTVTGGPAAGTPAVGTAAQFARRVIGMVNAQRATAGCGPVTANVKLTAAAQGRSDDMAARNYFAHATPEGVDPGARIAGTGYIAQTAGESIAKGYPDPTAALTGWMNSPEHRASILNCAFTRTGVGVNLTSTGSGGPRTSAGPARPCLDRGSDPRLAP